jgi:CheY-like chemotaxis protein
MADSKFLVVLVAHQSSPRRDLIISDLQSKGFDVLRAEDETTALRIVETHMPHGILAQQKSPEFDGVKLMKIIKKVHPRLPILILSDDPNISIEDTFDQGAEAVFYGSMSPEFFGLALQRHLSERTYFSGRQFSREPFRKDVKLNAPFGSGTIINIGRGGMFVSAQEDFPKAGATVEFSFEYKLEETSSMAKIEGTGVIRWVRERGRSAHEPAGYGIEFVSLSEESRGDLFRILNSLATTAYIPKGKSI